MPRLSACAFSGAGSDELDAVKLVCAPHPSLTQNVHGGLVKHYFSFVHVFQGGEVGMRSGPDWAVV